MPTVAAKYQPVAHWGRIPHGISFGTAATSVAVDGHDRVYVFNRGTVPVVVLEAEGEYLGCWGEKSEFALPHAVSVGPDDMVYLVDCGRSEVQKRTLSGELVLRLSGQASPRMSGEPFSMPTDVAVHASGDIYVSDGYGNARIHRFTADGDLVRSWGAPGTRPAQFAIPHGIVFVTDDVLAVCDRENYRVQLFDREGEYIREWHAFRPAAVARCTIGADVLCAVAEFAPPKIAASFSGVGHRVAFYDLEGNYCGHLGGDEVGTAPDQFINPHSVSVDSAGNIYVAEASRFVVDQLDIELPPGVELATLRKWKVA